ncbi:MAG: hypothetical protein VKK62_07065 [Synechococcaceae cyanobacterium]|nr:hypothetical protein [Synechococcaceae cyanobacterium]
MDQRFSRNHKRAALAMAITASSSPVALESLLGSWLDPVGFLKGFELFC